MRILILFILLLAASAPAQDFDLEKAKLAIKQTKNIFAPDKRTSIFDVDALRKDSLIILFGSTNLREAEKYLFEKLKKENIRIYDNIGLLPSEKLNEKIFGVINLSAANIRSMHTNWAEMSNQALLGTIVKVYKKEGGWLLIQTPDDYIGWTEDDAVQLMDEKEMKAWCYAEKIIFTGMYGTCYSEPDPGSLPVSDIILGNVLKKINEAGSFIKIEFPDKRKGFILEESTDDYKTWISHLNPSPEGILKTAKRFIGIPYLWGGTSIKGFDCSGFTKIIFLLNGIELPRDASQQVNVGDLVDTGKGFDSLQPGDLLFFGTKARDTIPEIIQHVALYAGNNEFIHASGKIQINSLDKSKKNFSSYRYNSFIKAKRIISSLNKNGVKSLNKLSCGRNEK
jgi:hypothetical protein